MATGALRPSSLTGLSSHSSPPNRSKPCHLGPARRDHYFDRRNTLQARLPLLAQLTTCRFKQKTVLPLTGDENDVLPFPEDLQWLEVFQVDPGAAEVLLTMQGFPLLLQETLGAGVCYILTFDPFGRSSPAPLTGEDWWKTLLPVSGVEGA